MNNNSLSYYSLYNFWKQRSEIRESDASKDERHPDQEDADPEIDPGKISLGKRINLKWIRETLF